MYKTVERKEVLGLLRILEHKLEADGLYVSADTCWKARRFIEENTTTPAT